MALNALSKAARGRPTAGRKVGFHVPLPASKRAREKSRDFTDQTFCRMYCKDSIGKFLGLPLANVRYIEADPEGTLISIPHQGPKVLRAVPDRVSARPYTILLQPGTLVTQKNYKWYLGENADDGIIDQVELKTLQFYLPAYMPIWRILDWLIGRKDTYVDDQGVSQALPGMTFTNYEKILALITPTQKTYNLESALYTNRVPPVDPVVLDPPIAAQGT